MKFSPTKWSDNSFFNSFIVNWFLLESKPTTSFSIDEASCPDFNRNFSKFFTTGERKIFAAPIPQHNEIIWFYPSSGSNEVDRYVVYNYLEQSWTIGTTNDGFTRTAWNPAYILNYPIAAGKIDDSGNNYLYNQEDGYSADGSNFTAFIESSDFDLDPDGERFMFISKLLPDIKFINTTDSGDTVDFIIKGRNYPLESLNTLQTVSVNPNSI